MPKEKPGYEAARAELIEVVRALEAGGTTLEESLALWERGEKLATVCQEWLDRARRRLAAAVDADEGCPSPGFSPGSSLSSGTLPAARAGRARRCRRPAASP